MNLAFIDFAIKSYDASLGDGDKARLAFFRELWGIVEESRAEQEATERNVPTVEQVEAAFADAKPVLAVHPAAIDVDRLAATQERLVECALEKGGFESETGEALKGVDWASVLRSSDCSLAGSDPAKFLESFSEVLAKQDIGETASYLALSLMSLAVRAQIEDPAATIVEVAGAERMSGLRTTHCPVCGSNPVVARVGGESSTDGRGKTLGCLQCGTSWEFERIRCAHCGTQNSKRLHYFNIEGDDSHRINTCDECGGYMRTTFVEDALAPFSFEVEDVVMTKLDALAAQSVLPK